MHYPAHFLKKSKFSTAVYGKTSSSECILTHQQSLELGRKSKRMTVKLPYKTSVTILLTEMKMCDSTAVLSSSSCPDSIPHSAVFSTRHFHLRSSIAEVLHTMLQQFWSLLTCSGIHLMNTVLKPTYSQMIVSTNSLHTATFICLLLVLHCPLFCPSDLVV